MANFNVVLFVLTIFASSSIFFILGQAPVDEYCLGCLCYAMTGCNQSVQCRGSICGPFSITWNYWSDAGKPTLAGEPPEQEGAYARCVNNANCAAAAVSQYMGKFARECNGDGIINCDDYLRIHVLGPYACSGNLEERFSNPYYLCKQASGRI